MIEWARFHRCGLMARVWLTSTCVAAIHGCRTHGGADMAPEEKPLVIALEEHYYDRELAATFDGPEGRAPEIRRRLDDLGEIRLKEMDEAGIDVQVISHGAPSTQRLDAENAVPLARNVNDRLAQAIAAHPSRFAGFAAL